MHAADQNRMAACALALMLSWPMSAAAAPWRGYVTLPTGDEVMARTQGRALRPSGSRGEVDMPVRVRFAAPVASSAGPVVMVDAIVRVLCQDRSVTTKAVKVRTADDKPFAARLRQDAVKAVQPSLDRALSSPAFIDKACQLPAA